MPQAWFYGEGGKLPVTPSYDDTLAKPPYALAENWDKSRETPVSSLCFKSDDVTSFNGNQKGKDLSLHLAYI
jgi:hypothetical protein